MSTKTDRLNLRCSSATLATLREAAEVQDQDLTSFILGAALDRARTVLAEDRVLRLDPHEVLQLERALDAEPAAILNSLPCCAVFAPPHRRGFDRRPTRLITHRRALLHEVLHFGSQAVPGATVTESWRR